MKRLSVWHHRAWVGDLSLNADGRWCFSYAPDWTAFFLSPHLPLGELRNDLAHQRTVEWFFDNLLPEGVLRTALAKREGLNEKDGWRILSRYGRDTAGALSVLPENEVPHDGQSFVPVSASQLSGMIEESRAGIPLMAQGTSPRMSLAGVQEKIGLCLMQDGSFRMPEGNTPSTHILKPENANPDYPFCPANEWFCMSLAKTILPETPTVTLMNVGAHRVYVVERFDRLRGDGNIRRLHQIDLCQACNVPPSRKYEDEAGLTAADMFFVAGHCAVPALAYRGLMRWTALNYLIGNSDAHAKNLSFLVQGQKLSVAPAYDLLCVDAWHQNFRLSMSIAGQNQAGWLEGAHWDAFALQHGQSPRLMRDILRQMVQAICHEQGKLLDQPCLMPVEKDWLRDCLVPVLAQRIAFAEDALKAPICNARNIHREKHVPADILEAIARRNQSKAE